MSSLPSLSRLQPTLVVQVAALRLYTTDAYRFMNGPLRDDDRYRRGEACPLPVTTHFAVQGIKKLRVHHVSSEKQACKRACMNAPEMDAGITMIHYWSVPACLHPTTGYETLLRI